MNSSIKSPAYTATAPAEATPPSRKTRILFIIDQLSEIGGAERMLASMVKGLSENAFECAVVTFKPGAKIAELGLKCPVYILPLRRTYDWNAVRVGLQLRRLIRSLEIQIVHTFFETADLWAGPIARFAGCKVLISSRRDLGILRSWKHRAAYRLAVRLYDEVHAVSNQVRMYCMENDRIPPQKIVTLYNGVAIGRTEPLPAPDLVAEMASRNSAALVVTVANIRQIKGIDVFLQAAAVVKRQFPQPVLFAVAGEELEPSYTAELRRMISDLGLTDCVMFLGKRRDVRAVLRASNVFCLLSRSEGLSNALLEAMAAGVACVATTVGGNGELIADRQNGYLIGSEDAEAAGERILTLLRDRETADRMAREARRTAETRFSTESMIGNLVSSYERLLKARISGPVYTGGVS